MVQCMDALRNVHCLWCREREREGEREGWERDVLQTHTSTTGSIVASSGANELGSLGEYSGLYLIST